jgi:choline monooxygenase
MEPYAFNPHLESAATLPASWYLDPEVLAKEQRAIFGQAWQWVGHADQLAQPGDFITCTIGMEPVVITRGDDGLLHAFSNVCRHRAGAVALGCGHRKKLQCQYHGWVYDLQGRLQRAPEFEGVEGFDPAHMRQPLFRVDSWGPFVFASTSLEGPSLHEWLGEIPSEAAPLQVNLLKPYITRDYHLACNWKVYVDNYLEGYHIPVAHPGLFKQIDYSQYDVIVRRWHSKQLTPIRPDLPESLYHRNLPEDAAPEALYYWIYPNLMLNIYPDNLQLNLILPDGPERTITHFAWFVRDPDRPGLKAEMEQSLAFSDEVQQEDILLCETVQKGLRSAHYHQGRYSVKRENGLHHFHGLVAASLQE